MGRTGERGGRENSKNLDGYHTGGKKRDYEEAWVAAELSKGKRLRWPKSRVNWAEF